MLYWKNHSIVKTGWLIFVTGFKELYHDGKSDILWQMSYFTSSNRKFLGYLHYDENTRTLRFASIRKDDYLYQPVMYKWEKSKTAVREIYPASILPDLDFDRMVCIEDKYFAYFSLYAKQSEKSRVTVFKLNTSDPQAHLYPNCELLSILYPLVPYELFLLLRNLTSCN